MRPASTPAPAELRGSRGGGDWALLSPASVSWWMVVVVYHGSEWRHAAPNGSRFRVKSAPRLLMGNP
jgi:hypothetical protein